MSNKNKPQPQPQPIAPPMLRTSAGLRDALFDEWDLLNQGKSNPRIAHAKAHLARQVIASVRAEIEFASHVRAGKPEDAIALTTPLQLSAQKV